MPPTRPNVERDTKRAAIVEHATELFARDGYDATSMKAVASAAGVTPNTLYWYFDDKDALFLSVLDGMVERGMHEAEANPPVHIIEQLLWLIGVLDEGRHLMSAVHARALFSPSVRAWHEAFHAVADAGMLAAAREHRRAQGLGEIDPPGFSGLPRLWSFALEGMVAHEVSPQERREMCELLVRQLEAL